MPDFWEHPAEAQKQMKKIKDIQAWLDGYKEVESAVEELSTAFEFVKEGLVEEEDVDRLYADAIEKIESLELRNMLLARRISWAWCSKSTPAPAAPKVRTGRRC